MKRSHALLFAGLFAITGLTSTAQAAAPILVEGVDIAPLVKFFEPEVKTFNKSITTYNWSANGAQDWWDVPRQPEDPAFLRTVQNQSTSYWYNYGSPEGSGNMYGYGLYTAIDPVTTVSFGGQRQGDRPAWLLLQLELPAGFRMVYANSMAPKKTGSEPVLASILTQFECSPSMSVDSFLVNGGAQLSKKCQTLGRAIFRDQLRIDGFSYIYGASSFKACEPSPWDTQRAFVITDSGFLKSGLIRYFNWKSTYEKETRIRIQTLFLSSKREQTGPEQAALDQLRTYLTTHSNTYVAASTSRCDAQCVITVRFCTDKAVCEDVTLAPINRPGGDLITKADADLSEFTGLIWKDLEGQPKAATISGWLKENRFACAGSYPYELDALPTDGDAK